MYVFPILEIRRRKGAGPGRSRVSGNKAHRAFTVVELLVATAIFAVILVVVMSVIDRATQVWRRSMDRVETYQGARAAFEMLTRNLSQATLNTYLDYDKAEKPTSYLRKSELKFYIAPCALAETPTAGVGQAVFFQAPVNLTARNQDFGGLDGLLNTCGYFVAFSSDEQTKPSFVQGSENYRFRLMQLIVPTEENTVYSSSGIGWFKDDLAAALPVADNVIALILRPQQPGPVPVNLAPNYFYDSAAAFSGTSQPDTSNQLPPIVQVTMIAIDESSARRLEAGSAQPSAITTALAGKFQVAAQFDEDLKNLREALNAEVPPIAHRVFSSAVPLRESKWSK